MRVRASVVALGAVALAAIGLTAPAAQAGPTRAAKPLAHSHLDCATRSQFCVDVNDPEAVFGNDHYVGHDEPAVLFYSNKKGAGNRMRYNLTLPKDPPPTDVPGARSYNFQLHVAFWLGVAMCDTQSYPEQRTDCPADSDKNIADPAKTANHTGTAFTEMQFYPPGYAPWPAGGSCDATKWCAALNIDSLSSNPVTGQDLNDACASRVGVEYVNFAFITRNGMPHAPPSPVNATAATFTPDPAADLFMNSGDKIAVSMQDTRHGLRVDLRDRTTGQTGFMTASARNGFGQVRYAPNPSTECTDLPYDFHPMYATSSEKTRVPWAAHSYNVAFSDEIGHFDFCTAVTTVGSTCKGTEGSGTDQEAADADDTFCFPAAASTLVHVDGCLGSNTGFDGVSYQRVWPDGSPQHPTPTMFTSPLTGREFENNYQRIGFEADLPRIEDPARGCDRFAGTGCTHLPVTDDLQPADFYPFYSTTRVAGCTWAEGNDVPGLTVRNFGREQQYGPILRLAYTALGGGVTFRFNDFRQILNNPCRARGDR
jgi:hypothetical protein